MSCSIIDSFCVTEFGTHQGALYLNAALEYGQDPVYGITGAMEGWVGMDGWTKGGSLYSVMWCSASAYDGKLHSDLGGVVCQLWV